MNPPSVSKSQVDRAGELLRSWWQTPDSRSNNDADLRRAVAAALDYRASFQGPQRKVTVGLRQFVQRESTEVIVAQRLKRLPQIINKLARFPMMRLSQMGDIGGCRAILPGGMPEVRGVLRRIEKNWDVERLHDYVDKPKETGYRAIHVIARRDERLIEIQLRTPGQHDWAEAVQRAADRTRFNLKDGEGPSELVRYFEQAALAIALMEQGVPIDKDFDRRFSKIRETVRKYFA